MSKILATARENELELVTRDPHLTGKELAQDLKDF